MHVVDLLYVDNSGLQYLDWKKFVLFMYAFLCFRCLCICTSSYSFVFFPRSFLDTYVCIMCSMVLKYLDASLLKLVTFWSWIPDAVLWT